jgi:predicted transposase/invertase (TIGR01784 family)
METYLSKEEMLKYLISNMGEELAEVKEEGIQEGLQQGMQEGMQQERQQTALNALKMGLSLQDVSKITSLPISELEEIKSRL